MSGWSQPLMSSHMMHPQLQAEQSAFSQHQPMEQDDTGIANPTNNYHQPQHLPNSYMDFPKVRRSYGASHDEQCHCVVFFSSLTDRPITHALSRGCPCPCMEEP